MRDVLSGSARWAVIHGDCLQVMAGMPAESVESCVCDPPYGLGQNREKDVRAALTAWLSGEEYVAKGSGFMGRTWDSFVPGPEVWSEVYRVLKPGGHVLAFAGTRTADLMGISLRLAGFELRESIAWLYASGFPKSLDVSKAIDAAAGAERTGKRTVIADKWTDGGRRALAQGLTSYEITDGAPATDAAKQWDGWGTALKPAFEPVIVARKPLDGTVAANVLAHGTGAINVDGCRVEGAPRLPGTRTPGDGQGGGSSLSGSTRDRQIAYAANPPSGRWPANVILDENQAAELDRQSGERPGMSSGGDGRRDCSMFGVGGVTKPETIRNDSGGASRFFYCPKSSSAERNAGLDHFRALSGGEATQREDDSPGTQSPRAGAGRNGGARNPHPTVKPVELLRYLQRLVTPPGGVVLDPFAGSGSGGIAALLEGFRYVGIELNDSDEEPFVSVARARIAYADGRDFVPRESLRAEVAPKQRSLFETE